MIYAVTFESSEAMADSFPVDAESLRRHEARNLAHGNCERNPSAMALGLGIQSVEHLNTRSLAVYNPSGHPIITGPSSF
jgi:hypothetical protein